MNYNEIANQVEALKDKALFILNHEGYKIGYDTALSEKKVRSFSFYDKFFEITYEDSIELVSIAVEVSLLEMDMNDLKAMLDKNVEEHRLYLALKKKYPNS